MDCRVTNLRCIEGKVPENCMHYTTTTTLITIVSIFVSCLLVFLHNFLKKKVKKTVIKEG